MLVVAILSSLASAAEGYYHPDDVAGLSTVFAQAAEQMGPAFEDKQSELSHVGTALEEMELGVALLGARAPEELSQWAERTRRKITGQYLQIQKHVDLLQDDYAKVFGDALERATKTVPGAADAEECKGKGGLAGMMGPGGGGGGGSCSGKNLNASLAKAIDADPELQADVAEIGEVPWPDVAIPTEERAVVPVTGDKRYVHLGALSKALMRDRIVALQDSLEADLEMMPGLDEGDAAALEQAKKKKQAYLAELARLGTTIDGVVGEALERGAKKGGVKSVGYCANPEVLGGCAGEDVTGDVLEQLRDDRKFNKALGKL